MNAHEKQNDFPNTLKSCSRYPVCMSGHLHADYFSVSLCTDVSVSVCSSRAFPQKGITQSAWTDCTALPSFIQLTTLHTARHKHALHNPKINSSNRKSIMIINVTRGGYWRLNTVIEVHFR